MKTSVTSKCGHEPRRFPKFDSLVKYRKYDEEKATKKLLRLLRQSASEYVGTSDGLIVSDV